MKEQEMAEKNKILEIRSGSHLYGTNTPESDEDFVGVFMADIDYVLGIYNVENVSLGKKSKLESGKNAPDAIDRQFYELRKFIMLLKDNNPNILEVVFVNNENIIFCNKYGEELLENRDLFLSQNIYHRFLGYSYSQKHKMVIKLSNLERLKEAKEYLEDNITRFTYINEIDHPIFQRVKGNIIRIGDVNLQSNITTKKAIKDLEGRIGKFTYRKELIEEFGYDLKFASNLIRLILEGEELLEMGSLRFPLKDAPLLRCIRQGKFSLKEIIQMSEEMEQNFFHLFEKKLLPVNPNLNKINKLLINLYQSFLPCGTKKNV